MYVIISQEQCGRKKSQIPLKAPKVKPIAIWFIYMYILILSTPSNLIMTHTLKKMLSLGRPREATLQGAGHIAQGNNSLGFGA